MHEPIVDVLLLLALPASGKSEIRRYLDHPDTPRDALHLGTPVQLDDYPYVYLMRRISQEQRRLGVTPAFFADDHTPFRDPRDWLTLIHLVNEDFASLGGPVEPPTAPSTIDRIEAARRRAGIDTPSIGGERAQIEEAIADDLPGEAAARPDPGATIVIEFARGGPEGASPPLSYPFGYQHSLAALDPSILERASILYVWVTPEESRRRNRERAIPGREGEASILHHGVPETVMEKDYGMDDIDWLEASSPVPGTIAVEAGGDTHLLPFARFDNRDDHTSFLRSDPSEWGDEDLGPLRTGLTAALDRIALGAVDSDPAE